MLQKGKSDVCTSNANWQCHMYKYRRSVVLTVLGIFNSSLWFIDKAASEVN